MTENLDLFRGMPGEIPVVLPLGDATIQAFSVLLQRDCGFGVSSFLENWAKLLSSPRLRKSMAGIAWIDVNDFELICQEMLFKQSQISYSEDIPARLNWIAWAIGLTLSTRNLDDIQTFISRARFRQFDHSGRRLAPMDGTTKGQRLA